MDKKFLYNELELLKKYDQLLDIPDMVYKNLADNIVLREYQEEAFKYFITYYENDKVNEGKQKHTLFHMATGSGKTVIMAGLILYLYTKGYRNFLFFVNQTNIVEKTKENFLNSTSSKYLFKDRIEYAGNVLKINEVSNFTGTNLSLDINICFTTTQKLHLDLMYPRENTITFQDFEDKKIVFISDESHHVNTLTKAAGKELRKDSKSWESSVMGAFKSNPENMLLEFTATANLKDKNVEAKYLDKIIYDYSLSKFRESGYTKDFQNFATDTTLWERALIAMIISQYRKYLFSDARINAKPVVMFKSRRITDSEDFYSEFLANLSKLEKKDIDSLEYSNMDALVDALEYFREQDPSYSVLINSLKEDFSEKNTIIMNGASDNTREKQLLVNSLEDADNTIRAIFAVDMLNEGWDVLNLFDIVRLYDTRGGKSYTTKEAQLIGRGARYFPYQITKEQERFKRKYDHDVSNEYRILETMYFHSKNDSKYISELRDALIKTGMQDDESVQREYKVKDSFKETELYKKGQIYTNERIPKGRKEIKEIEQEIKHRTYHYIQSTARGNVTTLFGEIPTKEEVANLTGKKYFKYKDLDYNLMLGGSSGYTELSFHYLKEKYPNLKNKQEFFQSESYLGNNTLEISYIEEVTSTDVYNALKESFANVASHVLNIKQEYEGSKVFKPSAISETITDKTVNISKIDKGGGRGESQITTTNEMYQLNLFEEDWYVYNDNYGTSEEKLALKYFKTDIEPKLKEKGLNYYVIRNERIPELALYSFEDGEKFEPDFIIIIEKKEKDKIKYHQAFLEPKGTNILEHDKWKEDFLLDIAKEGEVENNLFAMSNEYTIIGLPFFNSEKRMQEFTEVISYWIEQI